MECKVIQVLQDRYAGRSILSDSLPDEAVDTLLEAARLSPSCFNKQPWRFLLLKSDDALQKGREVLAEGNRVWAQRAPLLVIGYTKAEDDCQLKDGREYHQFDLGMSVMNLMLAATELGLVARPMAGFRLKKAKELFRLDQDDQPLIMIAVGKPSDDESHLPDHYVGRAKAPRERMEKTEIARIL